jgi:hypothetical protein
MQEKLDRKIFEGSVVKFSIAVKIAFSHLKILSKFIEIKFEKNLRLYYNNVNITLKLPSFKVILIRLIN